MGAAPVATKKIPGRGKRAKAPAKLKAGKSTSGLTGWNKVSGRDAIAKTFVFPDFNQAFSFMGRVAMEAERLGHHPEWRNDYNRVEVTLTTHKVGRVTSRDIAFAKIIDQLAGLA